MKSPFVIYLFICVLLDKAVNSSDCVASNNKLIINNKLERIRKEAIIAQFKNFPAFA
jgi:hypothetical protein